MQSGKSEFFECECRSDEHTVKFMVDVDDAHTVNWRVYLTIHLNEFYSFWKRVKVGVKYIFGYKCKYGNWDEFILNPQDATRIRLLLEKFEETRLDHILKSANKDIK